MRKVVTWISILVCILFILEGCGGSGGSQSSDTQDNINITGGVQKGPFVIGSTVTVNRLTEQGENTDSTIITNTIDNLGNFRFSMEEPGLVQISSTGYHRNEITGELSSGTLTLRSIYQATDDTDQHAYVNLLTHIVSQRVLNLIKSNNMPYNEASLQAENEFLSTFSDVIPNTTTDDFTSLTIFGDQSSLGNSYLLAVSSILYQYAIQESDKNASGADAELTLLINQFSSDFESDGEINDTSKLAELREVIPQINPIRVQENIDNWISDASGYSPADINDYLDSDLDGIVNTIDQDDDNDGINDLIDSSPYTPGFSVSNQDVTTDEDVPVVIDISSNNPLNTGITLEIKKQPSNGTLSGSYPDLTFTPNNNYAGVDDFKYVLSQSGISSIEATVTITVLPINDAPIISGSPLSEVIANESYSFTPSVINIDNDQLLFSIENLPAWATFNETTGQLSGVPANNDSGSYDNIVISVSDGSLSVSLAPFSIGVSTNPWTQLSAMPTGLDNPGVASNGSKIYVSGGERKSMVEFSVLEVYDITTDSWEELAAPIEIGRIGHSSHVINDVLYVIGGEQGIGELASEGYGETASVMAYDINTNTWSNKKSLSVERSFHASCVFNGKIYVFGGFTEDGNLWYTHNLSLATVEMYDPATNTWTPKSSMPTNNWGMSCEVIDNKIYLIGGAYNETGYEIYDPTSDSWSPGGSLNSIKRYGFATSFIDNKLYVLGGYFKTPENYKTDLVEALDFNTNTWSTKTPMPSARLTMGYVTVDGLVYIFGGGGYLDDNLDNTVISYDPLFD